MTYRTMDRPSHVGGQDKGCQAATLRGASAGLIIKIAKMAGYNRVKMGAP